jgi:hypothetical protein
LFGIHKLCINKVVLQQAFPVWKNKNTIFQPQFIGALARPWSEKTMTVYQNPAPHPDREDDLLERGAETGLGSDPLNPAPELDDPVRVYERPEQSSRTNTSLLPTVLGLLLLLILAYLAIQFLF